MRAFLAGTLLVVALAVAGCGGGSSPGGSNGEAGKSGKQVIADAGKAANEASSFHMSGQITTGGQQSGLDLTIEKGKGATGSITLGGQKVDLVVIGNEGYMRAPAAFWTLFAGAAGSTIGTMLDGKWLAFPTNNAQFGQITGIASSKSIFDKLSATKGTLTNQGATTYNGQSVVAIYSGSQKATLYVAGTGTAYPIAIVPKKGTGSGSVTFDKWGQSVSVSAPSGTVDISKLGLGG